MATPETQFYPSGTSEPLFQPKKDKNHKARVIRRGDRPLRLDADRVDQANLARIENNKWPKKGNLSTGDVLELREAEKTFPKIDQIIDQSLHRPVERTMLKKKRPAEHKLSDLEKDVLRHSAHAKPEKDKAKARKKFDQLFDTPPSIEDDSKYVH